MTQRTMPSSRCTHENRTSEMRLEHLTRQGVTERLELVLVDRGVTAAGARKLGRRQGLEVRRVGWDSPTAGWDAPADWRSRSRTHHHLSDRLAPGRLHRDHP